MKRVTLQSLLFVFVFGVVLAISCSKEKDDTPQPVQETPIVKNFSPLEGKVGTSVAISGTNFSATMTENTVKFGSTTADVTAATTTLLTTSVPDGAQTGKISVTVNGKTGSSTNNFIVLPNETQEELQITSISTESGTVGTQVTITGTGFSTTTTQNTVKFGDTVAEVNSASTTQLVVTVPDGATDGKISVTVDGTTVQSTNTFTIIPDGEGLQITSLSVTQGTVGTQVTITGTGFSSTTTENTVKFGGDVIAEVDSASATQLVVTVPDGATDGKITVTVDGTTVQSPEDFIVLLPLEINNISPLSGPVGTVVTIEGTGFGATLVENTVKFGGDISAEVTSATVFQLEVVVPEGAMDGKISVTVDGETVISDQDFIVLPPPTISSFSPSSGGVGTEVTINGAHFSDVMANNTVMFGDVQANITFASSNQLKVIAPTPQEKNVTIKVTVGSQSASPQSQFTYTPWKKLGDFPGVGRTNSFAETVNNIIYIGLGISQGFQTLQDFWAYDPATDTWTQKADFPGGNRHSVYSFVLNGEIFAGGGSDGTNTLWGDLYKYNPGSNTWTEMFSMEGLDYQVRLSTAFNYNGYVVVYGAIDLQNSSRADRWRYPKTNFFNQDKWEYEAPIPNHPRLHGAVSFSLNGEPHFGLGKTDNSFNTEIRNYKFNQQTTIHPEGGVYGAVAGVINNKAYIGMGIDNTNNISNTMYEYNPSGNTWTKKESFTGVERKWTWDTVANGKLYIGCGVLDDNTTYTSEVWEYDPSIDFTNN